MIRNLHVRKVIFGSISKGMDLYREILRVVSEAGIKCGAVFVIGALDKLKIGYYNPLKKNYDIITVEGLFEISSGLGNITIDEEGNTILHLHITAQESSGRTYAGHLLEGSRVGVTAEYIIFEFDGLVRRKYLKDLNLKVIT